MIKKLRRLFGSGDNEMKEALSHAKIAFILRIFGAGLSFLFNSAVARLLGADGAGIYFLALSFMMISAVVGRLGLENSLLRFIASGIAAGQSDRVRGVFATSMRWTLLSTGTIAVATILLAGPAAYHVFNDPDLVWPLRLMAVAIISFSVATSTSFALKGLKKVAQASYVANLIHPSLALLLLWPLTENFAVSGAVMSYVLGTVAAALIGWWMWRRNMATLPCGPSEFPISELTASSRPLWISQIVLRGLVPWAPVFLMGIWASSSDTAIIGIATRISLLIALVLQAVTASVSPQYAKLYSAGEYRRLASMIRRFSLLLTAAASPIFLVMVVFNTSIMSMFGEGFAEGGMVLAILAVGQFVNTLCGTTFAVLTMSGHERDVRNTTLVTAAVLGVLCVLLIPPYAAIGGALSISATVIVNNALAMIQIRRRLGITALYGLHYLLPDKIRAATDPR